jgi:hypothetical protein
VPRGAVLTLHFSLSRTMFAKRLPGPRCAPIDRPLEYDFEAQGRQLSDGKSLFLHYTKAAVASVKWMPA